jgi:sorbitol-specific phosphotransferase system component IIC
MAKLGFDVFIRNMLSGSGNVSSKRVSGIISLLISLMCIIYLVLTEGGTTVVENLLQTVLIMAACLLGVSSVTSIWKGPQGPHKKNHE